MRSVSTETAFVKLTISKVHQSGYSGAKERGTLLRDIDVEIRIVISLCNALSDKAANWQCCDSRILSLLIRMSDEGHVQRKDF